MPRAQATTIDYRNSGGVQPEPSQPESRGRVAGAKVVSGKQLVRENELRGGRVSNNETAGRGQASLAQSQDSLGETLVGNGFQNAGFGGGGAGDKNDIGAGLSPAATGTDPARGSGRETVQSEGIAFGDSYAISDFSEPMEDQSNVSSIAPTEDYDVNFDARGILQYDGRATLQSANRKSTASFTIPPSAKPTPSQAVPTEGVTSWQLQTSSDNRANWAETEGSLGLAKQSAGQGIRAGEQKATPVLQQRKRPALASSVPAPKPSNRSTLGSSQDRATIPNQYASVPSDQVKLGFVVSDAQPTPAEPTSFGIPQAYQPVGSVIHEQEKTVNELYRGVASRYETADEQLLMESRVPNNTPLPSVPSLARNDAGSETLDRGETPIGQELTQVEREEIVGADKTERDFVVVEEQLSAISAPDIQIDARFVEIDSENISATDSGPATFADGSIATQKFSDGKNPTLNMAVKQPERQVLAGQRSLDTVAAGDSLEDTIGLIDESKSTSPPVPETSRQETDSKSAEQLALYAKEQTDSSAETQDVKLLMQRARKNEAPALPNDTVKKKAEPAAAKPLPPDLEPRPEVQTAENPFSTFSLNVSDVSFKLAQASLENGQVPEGSQLRSEEFINAFDYHDPAPLPGQKLAFNWERARDPFAFDRDLLRFSIQTAAAGRQADQPLNLVVLLDNSGSMERSDRVEITHQMLAVLADQLNPNDRISVISFARTARLWVDGMPGGDPAELMRRVGRLNPEGGTNLEDALRSGYDIAQKHYNNYGNNRVILLTDGAANLGNVDPKALHEKVVEQRQRGIALDCFGVGWEGYNDSLLETLSRNGDGRYGFINQPEDAESEFADLLAGALQVAASDVKAQVEFNPERVTSYRQIGYLQHQLTKEQFRDNTVDAAEIGAAEAGNALYVTQINKNGTGPIGTVRVRYRVPATGLYEEREWELPYNPVSAALETSSPAMKLAATSASFAEWLAQSPHAAEVTLGELQSLLNGVPEAFAPDSRPQALQRMIQATRSISGQ